MELAAVATRHAVDVIEAIAPVEAEQAKHRQIDTYAHACRTLHVEGIEVLESQPTIACLKESECIYGGLWIE